MLKNDATPHGSPNKRLQIEIEGLVQGVGFRPFVYRLATHLGLTGWVRNTTQGVQIEIQGCPSDIERFLTRMREELPPRAGIDRQRVTPRELAADVDFSVRPSHAAGSTCSPVLPDVATCRSCLDEILDPSNRRYRYPFTNCTNCGPRYSIIHRLPYDRCHTTMSAFDMCETCRAEYQDPSNRRFHAQPNACPECGPHLELWDRQGRVLSVRDEALAAAGEAVGDGRIVALKGLGGFQLLVDAGNDEAVRLLRDRKGRHKKPFALMYPGLTHVELHCIVSPVERQLLLSPAAPIVLLACRRESPGHRVSRWVAPENPNLGVMLPYTPLHHLLMRRLRRPVVATSGNLAEEPICIDEHDALQRLSDIADLFLIHNRPIARQVDDSVVTAVLSRELVLRSARGYAPVMVSLPQPTVCTLAVGAHLKNTIAMGKGSQAVLSQHIGDLETVPAYRAFRQVWDSLSGLYEANPERIGCDMHPDYPSTRMARTAQLPVFEVQHHYAHVLACMLENHLRPPVLGVSWDGTGYGTDGTIWGGEFLLVDADGFKRVGHLRTFRLPGGEIAVREPRRSALGVLYELFGNNLVEMTHLPPVRSLGEQRAANLVRMLSANINSPRTSSAGRLFDVVASILGLCQVSEFEGDAAMMLEFAAGRTTCDDTYPVTIIEAGGTLVIDWEPVIRALLDDLIKDKAVETLAAGFHNTLAAAVTAVASRLGQRHVILTGGCFQNRYLTEATVDDLRQAGFTPHWHRRVPPNDGGVALGQLAAVVRSDRRET